MTFVSQLHPHELWRHFDKILTIPRGSKNEKQIAEYVISIAQRHRLEYRTDDVGNIVVSKPAVAGNEKAKVTTLQSHLDMVNEKNSDVEHDFSKDAIKPREKDGYLYATGTTLGSDNGIGVAAALAVMESTSIQHGPLEFLFTVDEETGLTGAAGLTGDFLEGQYLLNLDTEEEGSLYVGCAGGAGVNINLPLACVACSEASVVLTVKLHGLRGGHSGVDIHLQRGNAIKLLARALLATGDQVPFDLIDLHGGNMHNAIPREAFATLAIAPERSDQIRNELDRQACLIEAEFRAAEPAIKLTVEEVSGVAQVLDVASGQTVLNLLNGLPHGVMSMSYDIPELVETSSNVASANMENGELRIHVSNRSSVDSAIKAIQRRVVSIARLAGAETEEVEGYPGWQPNLNSQVLQLAKQAHIELLGSEPEVKAIHAGLECGLIGERYPRMDMVSFGPQIEFPHSPDERVKIKSVADFYQLLTGLVERLAQV